MKKTPFLLKSAAAGMLFFAACSDDSGNSASISSTGACLLNPTENGLEILCNKESYGLIKSSEDGIYGASCTAEALKDDSGYKLICGGDSVGVVYNGDHGRNGVNGTNGLPGAPGETGAPGANGTSCSAVQVDDGFDLFCDEKKVGTISSGLPCSSKETEDGVSISCPDGTSAVVKNGVNGTNGLNGTSCTTSSLKSSDLNGVYSTITCGTTTVKIYDGAKGEQGEQGDPGENCSVSKNTTTGVTTITCGEDVALVNDGAAGAKGDAGYSCSATSAVGYSIISCQTGVDTDGNPIMKNDTVLAAGYAKCLDGEDAVKGFYNTLTHGCLSTGLIIPLTDKCGDAKLAATEFCYNDAVYNIADYWTKTTDYPKASYDAQCGSAYYNSESHFCYAGTIVVEKCGEKTYDYLNQYCDETDAENPVVKNIYAGCALESGVRLYDTRVQFCTYVTTSGNYDIYDLCGGQTYEPTTHECVNGSVHAKEPQP